MENQKETNRRGARRFVNSPDVRVMKSFIGAVSIVDAVSELVDNAVDAGATHIMFSVEDDEMIITDNGSGMSIDELENAMKLGHSEKDLQERGYYGVGLKSAAFSLGKKVLIVTKEKGVKDVAYIESDIEKGYGSDQTIGYIDDEDRDIDSSFTSILIEGLSHFKTSQSIDGLRNHMLRKRFSEDIKRGLKIIVNGTKLKPLSREVIDDSIIYFSEELSNGEYVTGKLYSLKGTINRGRIDGFRLLRNGRVIVLNEVFRPLYSKIPARCSGEIVIPSSINVSSNKKEFDTDSDLYRELLDKIKPYLDQLINDARIYDRENESKRHGIKIDARIKKELEQNLKNIQEILGVGKDIVVKNKGGSMGKNDIVADDDNVLFEKRGNTVSFVAKNKTKKDKNISNNKKDGSDSDKSKKEKKTMHGFEMKVMGHTFIVKQEYIEDRNIYYRSTLNDDSSVITVVLNKNAKVVDYGHAQQSIFQALMISEAISEQLVNSSKYRKASGSVDKITLRNQILAGTVY